ncbi:hypothetical protein Tco_0962777, partial [Tanacetum coccineum]
HEICTCSLEDISSSKKLKTQVFYTLRKKKIKEDNTKSKNKAKYAALLRKYAALQDEVNEGQLIPLLRRTSTSCAPHFISGLKFYALKKQTIRGTFVDGEWIVDPLAVKGLFSGIPIDSSADDYLTVSLMDDSKIFIGKHDSLNIRTIANVLKCFHLASGLKINFYKSKVMGIDTRLEEFDAPATTMGYSILTTSFVHLGVKVGGVMSRIQSWDDVVAKVSYSLSKWKLKTLSIDIICEVTVLRTKGINVLDLICKMVGNELNTLFCEYPWLDDLAFKHKLPRLYALDNYKQITVGKKISYASKVDTFRRPPRGGAEEEQLGLLLSRIDGLILTNIPECWVWSLEAMGEFSYKYVCQLIDDSILPKEGVVIR